MGIYNRDYYRRDGPSFLSMITEQGRVCRWLIGINIVCFILQFMVQTSRVVPVEVEDGRYVGVAEQVQPVTEALELNADLVVHGQVWRLVTYAFLHAGPWHILWNMLFLWWFGKDLEIVYGQREFLLFYLTAAVVGGICFTLAALAGSGSNLCIGASGAVTAILVLSAIHFPGRIIYLSFLIPVPLWLFVIANVAFDTFAFVSQAKTGVAVTVHLGGAAFAWLYHRRRWHLYRTVQDSRSWLQALFRPKLRIYREEQPHPVPVVAVPEIGESDEHLEAKLDAVLAKVARSGQQSLTDGERQILMRASEIYKRRRT